MGFEQKDSQKHKVKKWNYGSTQQSFYDAVFLKKKIIIDMYYCKQIWTDYCLHEKSAYQDKANRKTEIELGD